VDIILVSGRFAKARTIRLNGARLLGLALLAGTILVTTAIAAQYVLVRMHSALVSDDMRAWLASAQTEEQHKQQVYMRASLDAMAKRVGQMQAQMMRLDALGARLAKTAGIKPQEMSFDKLPAEGGPYVPAAQPDISLDNMAQQLNKLTLSMDDRGDKLSALETWMMQSHSNKWLIPSVMPVKHSWISSGFGKRIDPITGKVEIHEGVDFPVPKGTPIYASAGGVVEYAGFNPSGFGNLVEIDHGNGVMTRYAHNSKVLVKVGQIVKRGQEISLSGTTGRSTGPHLHFEVRYHGVAEDPIRFLKKASS
jgi:hypothetical protein